MVHLNGEKVGVPKPEYVPISTADGKPTNLLVTAINIYLPVDSELLAQVNPHVLDASNTEGGQRNFVGCSYGSTVAAQSALALADDGIVVDNIVLIGSPIASDSELYPKLISHPNIKNVQRIDIPNDPFSNGVHFSNGNISTWMGQFQSHFLYTTNENGQQDRLVESISEELKSNSTR